MRRLVVAGVIILGLVRLVGATGVAPDPTGLDRLKSLAGTWEGKDREGKTAQVRYEVVSNGSAVVETLSVGEMETMVTVYHKDGDQLMLTHYCGAGNQPRMRADKGAQGGVLRFSFVDATNMPNPDAGHMHKLALTFRDPDHLTQEWTFRDKGQEHAEVIDLARKK
jgi:hypothetical protein